MKISPARGFSLVELLAVIVVISVLVALLVPAVANIAARVRTTVCGSRLHHLGIAWTARRADNPQTPVMANWPGEISSYLDGIDTPFFCPEGLGSGATTVVVDDGGGDAGGEHVIDLRSCGYKIFPASMQDSMWVWDMTEAVWQQWWARGNRSVGYNENYAWYIAHQPNGIPQNAPVIYKVFEDVPNSDPTWRDNFFDQHWRYESLSGGRVSITCMKGPGARDRHDLMDNDVEMLSNIGYDWSDPYEIGGSVRGWSEYQVIETTPVSYGMNVAAAEFSSGDRKILALDFKKTLANDGDPFISEADDEGVALRHRNGSGNGANVLWTDGGVQLMSAADIDPAFHPELWQP